MSDVATEYIVLISVARFFVNPSNTPNARIVEERTQSKILPALYCRTAFKFYSEEIWTHPVRLIILIFCACQISTSGLNVRIFSMVPLIDSLKTQLFQVPENL